MKQAIFQSVFNHNWDKLPPVMRKHYFNRPFSGDVVVAEGKMEIKFGWYFYMLAPWVRLFGVLAPYKASNMDVNVKYLSEYDSEAFCLVRSFDLPGDKTHIFKSRMFKVKGNELIEVMGSGIAWKHLYVFEDNKVLLNHKGYAWKIFDSLIPLPLSFIIGKVYAEEFALSDDSFAMNMKIKHPLFGVVYEYGGTFKITDIPHE